MNVEECFDEDTKELGDAMVGGTMEHDDAAAVDGEHLEARLNAEGVVEEYIVVEDKFDGIVFTIVVTQVCLVSLPAVVLIVVLFSFICWSCAGIGSATTGVRLLRGFMTLITNLSLCFLVRVTEDVALTCSILDLEIVVELSSFARFPGCAELASFAILSIVNSGTSFDCITLLAQGSTALTTGSECSSSIKSSVEGNGSGTEFGFVVTWLFDSESVLVTPEETADTTEVMEHVVSVERATTVNVG